MKQSDFIHLIEFPNRATASDLGKIETLKTEFPFFQSAHLLLSVLSKKYDSSLYQQTLRNTAITIPNRARLFNLLNEPEIKEPIVIGEEMNVVPDIKEETPVVFSEPVTKNDSKEVSEIEHLKAIELDAERTVEKTREAELNEQVEKEIEKQIVNAFVEKEILKTPDLHKEEPGRERLEAGSFSDWLKALKGMDRPSEPEEIKREQPKKTVKPTPKPASKKEEQKSIIDKVIESNPGNIRLNPNQKFFTPDIKAKESLFENEDLVTETLAKIYALQGNISKAVRAYEILSLKFPQKSAYFASLTEN